MRSPLLLILLFTQLAWSAVNDPNDYKWSGEHTFGGSIILGADLQAGGKKITGLADGEADSDAATVGQLGGGGIAWSTPVDANIVPDGDGTWSLGSSGIRWLAGFFDQVHVRDMWVDSSTYIERGSTAVGSYVR